MVLVFEYIYMFVYEKSVKNGRTECAIVINQYVLKKITDTKNK